MSVAVNDMGLAAYSTPFDEYRSSRLAGILRNDSETECSKVVVERKDTIDTAPLDQAPVR